MKQSLVNSYKFLEKMFGDLTFSLKTKNSKLKTERGFTLLLASLVASVVLALGLAIFGIAQKQITLSTIARDSQFAFYAADTGAECALYWDIRDDINPNTFATSSGSMPIAAVSCNNTASAVTSSKFADYAISEFQFEPNGYCTKVRITKCRGNFNNGACAPDPAPIIRTLVHADGYNVRCSAIFEVDGTPKSTVDPRALQRSVELRY